MTQDQVDAVVRTSLRELELTFNHHKMMCIKIMCKLQDELEVEAIYHERVKKEYGEYRDLVVATLTREAHLASGMGLLTSPERLRELAKLLEEA